MVRLAWAFATGWSALRRPRVRKGDVRRQLWRDQARALDPQISEPLRDRLRSRWLRLQSETERNS